MNNKLTLKRLAEEHHFANRELTEEQYSLLKSSKYATVLKEPNTQFENVLENVFPGAEVEEKPVELFDSDYAHYHSPFYVHVDRHFIDGLVDNVKDKYNLGVENRKTSKYEDVDLHELKSFIKDYIKEHKAKSTLHNDEELHTLPIKDRLSRVKSKHLFHHTEKEVNHIVDDVAHDIYDVMDKLIAMSSNGY